REWCAKRKDRPRSLLKRSVRLFVSDGSRIILLDDHIEFQLQHGLNGLRGRPPEMESRFDSDRRSQKQWFEIRHKWEDIEEYSRVERNKVRAKGQEFFVDIIGIKYIYREIGRAHV